MCVFVCVIKLTFKKRMPEVCSVISVCMCDNPDTIISVSSVCISVIPDAFRLFISDCIFAILDACCSTILRSSDTQL